MKNVKAYITNLPDIRKKRISELRKYINENFPAAVESMKYKMPTFEYNNNWVATASQKHYLSVYFCSEELIDNVKKKYPQIKCGKGCLNIKDRDVFPIEEIGRSIAKAFKMKK